MCLQAEKIGDLPELANPSQLIIGDGHIYVADGASVYIYSFDKLKLIRKFGREGEGPGEFATRPNQPIQIIPGKKCIHIASLNKISQYGTRGDLIKENKYKARIVYTWPLGDRYVAKGATAVKDQFYFTVNIYDSQFKPLKELYREKMDPRHRINAIDATGPELLVHRNRIVINTTRNRNGFDIFDSAGKRLYRIENISHPIPMTSKIKGNYIHFLKNDPKFKRIYERLKSRLFYPDFMPLFRYIQADGDWMVGVSYPDADLKRQIFLFDTNGKQIKKMASPLVSPNVEEVYPFRLFRNQLYQLVENEEGEWELRRFVL